MKMRLNNTSNTGKLTLLVGVFILIPLGVLPFYPQDAQYARAFLYPGLGSILLGGGMCLRGFKERPEITMALQRGNALVLYAWLYSFVVGATPFVLGGKLTFVQGLFESVSGWTTTGLSVMDVAVTPHIFLFYRSFMQFCGGLGFVMIMIAFVQGKMAMYLYNAEGHSDKIMPTLRKTVRMIVTIYMAFFAVGALAYILCGMPVFDSLLHTMGALSTGGFSNMADSIGAYDNVAIEAVTVVLMLIGTTNFAILILFTQRKWRQALRCGEIKLMAVLLAVFVPIMALPLMAKLYVGLDEGLRQAVFNIVSALSTTGYSTMAYADWPPFALGIMILMMLVGGGIGSTAGGIKLSRTLILLKNTWRQVKGRISPENEVQDLSYHRAQGKTAVDAPLVSATAGFASAYLMIFAAGSLLITLTANVSLTEAMFDFASSLGTVGLSIGITGPDTNAATLVVEIFGMVLGRLEIFLVITGVYSAFYLARERMLGKRRKTRRENGEGL